MTCNSLFLMYIHVRLLTPKMKSWNKIKSNLFIPKVDYLHLGNKFKYIQDMAILYVLYVTWILLYHLAASSGYAKLSV